MQGRSVQKIVIETKQGSYACVFKWDAKDEAYLVVVPSLPGVVTFGTSLADAKRMAKDAIELFCECVVDDGNFIIDDQRKVIGKVPASRIVSLR